MLVSEKNAFAGRMVDPDALPTDPGDFEGELGASLQSWRAEGIRVVWLRLPIERASFVPIAVEAGFVYHHADEAGVMLIARLVSGSYAPPYATHYIGAGGAVFTDDHKLLVIQERHHKRRHYKLPGGALHPGEHIVDAVCREVEEETGIRTEFLSLVCFRHWHGYRHGKSDIYFVTRLKPLNLDINRDPREIAEAFWMPVAEYLSHPDTHAFNRTIVRAALQVHQNPTNALSPGEIEGYGTPETHEMFFPG